MIRAIPRYCPICALLNQLCSFLSTSTPISLRLNSSGLLLPLETFNKEDIFIYISFWTKLFCLVTRHKKVHVYAHNFSVSFFSSSGTQQSHHLDGCQATGINLCFLGLAFLMTIMPLNKFVIIAIVIVIITWFCLLFCNKPIGYIFQQPWPFLHCLITHILCFKGIRDIFQLPWVYFNFLNTLFLSFKMVRNIHQRAWPVAYCLVANLLRLKPMRNKFQCLWIITNSLFTHLLRLSQSGS